MRFNVCVRLCCGSVRFRDCVVAVRFMWVVCVLLRVHWCAVFGMWCGVMCCGVVCWVVLMGCDVCVVVCGDAVRGVFACVLCCVDMSRGISFGV